jgi:exopolysaccharide biosynthesis polyprenyl glycosylphosphotransferase
VEPQSFHITNPTDSPPRTEPHRPPAAPAGAPPSDRRRSSPVRLRMGLQRRARTNLRRHLTRAIRRFAVLLIADLASFYVMRALLRAVRDEAVLGDWLGGQLTTALPKGILNGWQFAAALLVGLLVTGNYGPGDQRRDPRRLFLACALATALPLWMTIWTRGVELVALQYILTTTFVWLGLVAERLTLDWAIARVPAAHGTAAPTLFLGPAEDCRASMRGPAFASPMEHRVIGFLDVHIPPAPDALGHIVDFARVLHDTPAETVVVCGYLTDARFHDVVDAALAAGCQLFSVPRAIDIAGVQPTLVWRQGQAMVELSAPSLKGWQFAIKRVIDFVGGVVGLVLVFPIVALIAAAIRIDSRGPIFFWQQRAGLGGRAFRMLKFRTMRDGADTEKASLAGLNQTGDSRLFKIQNDPRVTRLGAFLRRWSLDELPQLWNVVRGEMSLVGPRPFFERDFQTYQDHHFHRLGAKPGITGLWQVNGRSSISDFEEVVRLDRQYVEEWSVWLDLKILLLTLPAVLRRTGAY